MHKYKYLIPMFSQFPGFGILNRRLPPPFLYVRTKRNAPFNNFVITGRGTYVIARNVNL